MPKINAWNMDENPGSAPQYKDIVPGDQINQRQELSKAYSEMGEAMAEESYESQKRHEFGQQLTSSTQTMGNMPQISMGSPKNPLSVSLGVPVSEAATPKMTKKPSSIRRLLIIASIIIVLTVAGLILAQGANIKIGLSF